jgi:virulence-associated protein VagC
VVKELTIVTVDAQRRIYIPREVPFDAEKVVIIPQGSSYLLIPVPKSIVEIDVRESTEELRRKAEEKAKEEAKNAAGI